MVLIVSSTSVLQLGDSDIESSFFLLSLTYSLQGSRKSLWLGTTTRAWGQFTGNFEINARGICRRQ